MIDLDDFRSLKNRRSDEVHQFRRKWDPWVGLLDLHVPITPIHPLVKTVLHLAATCGCALLSVGFCCWLTDWWLTSAFAGLMFHAAWGANELIHDLTKVEYCSLDKLSDAHYPYLRRANQLLERRVMKEFNTLYRSLPPNAKIAEVQLQLERLARQQSH